MTDAVPGRRYEFLRLRDFLLLEHIAAQGSLRQVAQLMHVTQPAVTQALKSLEEAFGVQLVERAHNGVTLTPAGQAALVRLRAAHRDVQGALQAALAPRRIPLHLGVMPSAALELLPRLLAEYRQRAPAGPVVLAEASVPLLWARLQEGALDAVVSRLPLLVGGESMPEGIDHQVIAYETLAVVGAADHPLADANPTLAELVAGDWVLPPAQSWARRMWEEWVNAQGLQPPEPLVVSDSFQTNIRLVATSRLLTIAPATAVAQTGPAMGIRTLMRPWAERAMPIVVAFRTSRADDPLLRLLMDSARALVAA